MGVIGYFGAYVFPIWYLITTCLYFYRQNKHPINARLPLATGLIELILGSYSVNTGLVNMASGPRRCAWLWWALYLHHAAAIILVSYRVIILYLAFEVSFARATATSAESLENNKFLIYYEKWRSGKLLMMVYIPVMFAMVLPMIISHSNITFDDYSGICWYYPGILYTLVGIVSIAGFVIFMVIKFNHRVDNFGIRNEIVVWSAEITICVLAWILVIGFRLGDYWAIGDTICILAIFVGHLITICYPLYLSYTTDFKEDEAAYVKLREILLDTTNASSFQDFLITEFSCENLKCYLDLEAFERIFADPRADDWLAAARIKAQTLLQMYFNEGSPSEVNISYAKKKAICQKGAQLLTLNPETPTVETDIKDILQAFLVAKQELYILMETDSLPRYRKSPYFPRVSPRSSGRSGP